MFHDTNIDLPALRRGRGHHTASSNHDARIGGMTIARVEPRSTTVVPIKPIIGAREQGMLIGGGTITRVRAPHVAPAVGGRGVFRNHGRCCLLPWSLFVAVLLLFNY